MRLVVVGLSHRSAGVETLGLLALDEGRRRCLVENLRAGGADEVAVLATCNRTELYLVGADAAALSALGGHDLAELAGGASTLLDVLTSQTQLTQARLGLVQARFAARTARAQLEALVGSER